MYRQKDRKNGRTLLSPNRFLRYLKPIPSVDTFMDRTRFVVIYNLISDPSRMISEISRFETDRNRFPD